MLIRISQQPVAGTNKDLKNRNHHGTNIIGIPMPQIARTDRALV